MNTNHTVPPAGTDEAACFASARIFTSVASPSYALYTRAAGIPRPPTNHRNHASAFDRAPRTASTFA